MGFNRNNHIGDPSGLDHFGDLNSGGGSGIELVWQNTSNVLISDAGSGSIITDALVSGSGGASPNFTVRNPWTENELADNWCVCYTLSAGGAAMMGVAGYAKTANTYTDIDYTWWWPGAGEPNAIYVYELGAIKTSFMYNTGDNLKIMNVGTTVTYHINNVLVYTSLTSSSNTYKLKLSLYEVGAQVTVDNLIE